MKFKLIPLLLFSFFFSQAQEKFTHADTLRGSLRPERTCFDVGFYDLNLHIDLKNKSIKGFNDIYYTVKEDFKTLQVDLFESLKIEKIVQGKKKLKFKRVANAVFVSFDKTQKSGSENSIRIYYGGKPQEAVNAPWDGGFSWKKDDKKRPWIGVSCQGLGASVWWPNKDHLSDEPDSMRMTFSIAEKDLKIVSNGNLVSEKRTDTGYSATWKVSYPINNYDVTVNIGNYSHWSDTYTYNDNEVLALDYYVLDYNLEKAKKQFNMVKPMLKAFDKRIGKYPFMKDGYALVETPYVGMEHQSAVAYGNQYTNGYMGRQMEGLDFDFIILHESGHEWFGNSLSCNDMAELWLHETFTTYIESVYIEELYDPKTAVKYINWNGQFVANEKPMIGKFGVNDESHDTDIYYKGALMLNTLRSDINNDEVFWSIIRGFYEKYALGHAKTQDFIDLVKEKAKKDYAAFFKQYLENAEIPILHLTATPVRGQENRYNLTFYWEANVKEFDMNVVIVVDGEEKRIHPTTVPVNIQYEGKFPKEIFVKKDYFYVRESK